MVMSARALVTLSIIAALTLAACTRSSDEATPDDPAFAPASHTGPVAEVGIALEQPADGASVGSPVVVSGVAQVDPGRTMAAQVRSREADGSWRWLGNGALALEADGRFEGEVAYSLAGAAAGVLEVLVVDPASGTVLQRTEVEVDLEPSG